MAARKASTATVESTVAPTESEATLTPEAKAFAEACGLFSEGFDSLSRMIITKSIELFESIADTLLPVYDVFNADHRADQVKRSTKTVQDLGAKAFRDMMLGASEYKAGAASLTEVQIRQALFFGRVHTAETETSYSADCVERRALGSWTGYVAWLRDFVADRDGKVYRNADGSLTADGVARKAARESQTTVDVGPVVDLGSGDHISQFTGTEYARARAMLTTIHDMTWQANEFIAGLDESTQTKIRKDFKKFIADSTAS